MRGIFLLAENLLASQEGLCSVVLESESRRRKRKDEMSGKYGLGSVSPGFISFLIWTAVGLLLRR
jgi:hypothetical protein